MKKKLWVVKIGGNIIDDTEALDSFLKKFSQIKESKILVHGGGKMATALSQKLGIESQLVNGRRLTSAEELKIVTMVYAGWINKNIVSKLNAYQNYAIGISGADAQLIPAIQRPIKNIDYGFVGDVIPEKINHTFLKSILEQELTPVIAPITSNNQGVLLNTNADTVAANLALAMNAHFETKLVMCFEKKGVLQNPEDNNSVIRCISRKDYHILIKEGIVKEGMLPKLENAFFAIENGLQSVLIGLANNIELLNSNPESFGTTLTN
jgi:acetylglutamate kinase